MQSKIIKSGYTIVCKDNEIPKTIQSLVNKVLLKTAFKKEHGLFGDIEILDYDLDRVYLEVNDVEFTIRMWNVIDIPKGYKIVWTFFKDIPNEYGSHGEEIGCGESFVSKLEE